MKTSLTTTLAALLLTVSSGLCAEDAPKPLYPQYPSETPTNFAPVSDTRDYELRDVMIPMRDGVKLHTIILVPKGASRSQPLLRELALSETLDKVVAKKIQIYACRACSRARGVTETDLATWGAKFGNPAIFVSLVEWADRVITE
jgi:hypothetical protein